MKIFPCFVCASLLAGATLWLPIQAQVLDAPQKPGGRETLEGQAIDKSVAFVISAMQARVKEAAKLTSLPRVRAKIDSLSTDTKFQAKLQASLKKDFTKTDGSLDEAKIKKEIQAVSDAKLREIEQALGAGLMAPAGIVWPFCIVFGGC